MLYSQPVGTLHATSLRALKREIYKQSTIKTATRGLDRQEQHEPNLNLLNL